jgi:antitoxin (DNA-binding transcriptional repressor) of toxin-antitoxin stability system
MLDKQIAIQKQDANWDELLSLVHEGAEVVIMQADHALVKITGAEESPISSIQERVLGAHPGAWMSDDFDAPLP